MSSNYTAWIYLALFHFYKFPAGAPPWKKKQHCKCFLWKNQKPEHYYQIEIFPEKDPSV